MSKALELLKLLENRSEYAANTYLSGDTRTPTTLKEKLKHEFSKIGKLAHADQFMSFIKKHAPGAKFITKVTGMGQLIIAMLGDVTLGSFNDKTSMSLIGESYTLDEYIQANEALVESI